MEQRVIKVIKHPQENIFGFYTVMEEPLDLLVCDRCGQPIHNGDKICRVDNELLFPIGFSRNRKVHIYQLGEIYHTACVGYKEIEAK